jgi:hypothetical protein
VNQHGSEGKLAAAFKAESDRFRRTHGDSLSYVAFDFHQECGATRWVWGAGGGAGGELPSFGGLERGLVSE